MLPARAPSVVVVLAVRTALVLTFAAAVGLAASARAQEAMPGMAQMAPTTGATTTTSTGEPAPGVMTSNQAGAAAAAEHWTPPPPDPAQLRGLPVCARGTALPGPGERYTCRPAWDGNPGNVSFEWSFAQLGLGGVEAQRALTHSSFSYSVPLYFWIGHFFGIGARYQYLTGGARDHDLAAPIGEVDDPHHALNASLVSIGPRLRLWDDETSRDAWLFEADAGVMIDHNAIVPTGPFLRFAVGRQIGFATYPGAAFHFALLLEGQQGLLDAADFRSLQLGARMSYELSPPEPADLGRRSLPNSWDYVVGVKLDLFGVNTGATAAAGMVPGFGLAFGVPVFRWLEPRLEASFSYLQTITGHAPLQYTGLAALRFRFNDVLPAYVQVGAGWEFAMGTQPQGWGDGAVVDVALGLHAVGCAAGGSFGVRYQRGLMDANKDLQAVIVYFEGEYGSRGGALADERTSYDGYRCGAYAEPTVPLPPPPPAPPTPPEPPPPDARVDANLDASLDVNAHVDVPNVQVEIHPVTVEVPLGITIFGGALRASIDVSTLPLAQLRASGFVSVEIIGPEGALAQAEGELRASLGPDGARVEGWARTVASDRIDVRAIFTIWPAGSRPP